MLCLADRGFNDFEHWEQASATGTQLLWRCAVDRNLPVEQTLGDGSYLSTIRPAGVGVAQARTRAITVRVIGYVLPEMPDASKAAPAMELAELYYRPWELESIYDDLKMHLLRNPRVLRSRTAELVRQELFGWVLMNYTVRWLLYQGAVRHRMPHADLSFSGRVQMVRRQQPLSGPPVPKRARESAGAASRDSLMPAPACVPAGPSTGNRHAWSSDETRSTARSSGARSALADRLHAPARAADAGGPAWTNTAAAARMAQK